MGIGATSQGQVVARSAVDVGGTLTKTTLLTRMAHWRKIGAAVNGRRSVPYSTGNGWKISRPLMARSKHECNPLGYTFTGRSGAMPAGSIRLGNSWGISRAAMAQPKRECNPLGYTFTGRCDSGSSGIASALPRPDPRSADVLPPACPPEARPARRRLARWRRLIVGSVLEIAGQRRLARSPRSPAPRRIDKAAPRSRGGRPWFSTVYV